MKVVVCGAGIAGLALAWRLRSHGAEVVLVEKASGPRAEGYMLDFFGPGYDAAEAMGVLPRIRELGYRVDEMTYHDHNGRTRSRMAYAQLAKVVRGRLTSVTRPDLERALREGLPAGIDVRYATTITRIDDRPDGVTLTLTGGGTRPAGSHADGVTPSGVDVIDADLLVGADGVHSWVRAQVFGPEREHLRYLGFHTAAYTFHDPDVHARVAGRFSLTDTVDRQMGFYGLRDGRVAVFAVHRAADPAPPADPRAALREEYRTLGWVVPRALAACPPPDEVYYDQVAQIDMPAWSRGRVALVGDAAYAVSLLAGQGASLGIAGACLLADLLAADSPVETALRAYEQALRPVIADKQRVARDGARWFVPATTGRLRLRRAALKLSHLPLVNRAVATTIAGKPTTLTDL
ncbi:FAD-dependent oxidoreductase [Sphaerisporangium siamense]|uniref:2-polyprenyl-6-methoxyphenol hydroxylase-like FAD-dependent oxidoreductase n=1 Tax=Sphaerisporangium siamense TaxID=795645 RepID=A0A7W7D561_9ACTN|nr:FAD-dependent oxidoreductase [Sphaerisporangium siamense]MBB4699096.1 2-polyprenyl-6-methoxyphenol hydroxylase-like FAD-dependent oxidoreductase [Sphaerisporangium siamense]GII86777.1 FAD-dependent oxidoreductase [Sphaerisporangium siamense]